MPSTVETILRVYSMEATLDVKATNVVDASYRQILVTEGVRRQLELAI